MIFLQNIQDEPCIISNRSIIETQRNYFFISWYLPSKRISGKNPIRIK